jgi:flagellar biosynthetic protein FliO
MQKTKEWVLLTALTMGLSFSIFAEDAAKLLNVTHQTITEGTEGNSESSFQTTLTFDKDITNEATMVDFINQTIQVDVANTTMTKARDRQKVENGQVKSLYTYRPTDGVVRHRMILDNDQSADTFKDRIDIAKSGNALTITLKGNTSAEQILKGALPPKSLDQAPATQSNGDMEEEIQAAAQNPVQSSAKAEAVVAEATEATTALDKKSEESTPIFKTPITAGGKSQGLWQRLLISIGVLIAAATGLVLFAKWWAKTHKKNPMAGKIEVVSQFHLGPKKSLVIVRVAGDFILLGITDHNISMIKTLSLIDDEFEEQLTKLNSKSDGADPLAKLFGRRANDMGNIL